MRHRRHRVLLLLGLAVCGCVEIAGAQEPVYLQRLRLPVLRDDIGFGHAVTVDTHTGEIFVCDPRTNRILIFDRDGYFSYQILGGEEFSAPQDIAVDPDGLLLVIANRGERRTPLELDFDGTFRREIRLIGLPEGLGPPRFTSIALADDGERVFLVDDANERVWISDRDGKILGSADPNPDSGGDTARDLFLGHIDVYGDTALLAVASEGEIRRFDLDGRLKGSVGAKGTAPCQLGRPTAAALTDGDELLVIDQQRMLLSRWSVSGNRCLGEYIGFGSAPGYLYYPFDLALDARGRFYIGQSWDGRVQVFEGMGAAQATARP